MAEKPKGRKAKAARGRESLTADRQVTSTMMGARLRALRTKKNFSQGDVERGTGLLRCYVSRVENGHTIPSVETLEKFARVLDVPLYKLFYEGEEPPTGPLLKALPSMEELAAPGREGEDARYLLKIKNLISKINDSDRDVLLTLTRKLAFR